MKPRPHYPRRVDCGPMRPRRFALIMSALFAAAMTGALILALYGVSMP